MSILLYVSHNKESVRHHVWCIYIQFFSNTSHRRRIPSIYYYLWLVVWIITNVSIRLKSSFFVWISRFVTMNQMCYFFRKFCVYWVRFLIWINGVKYVDRCKISFFEETSNFSLALTFFWLPHLPVITNVHEILQHVYIYVLMRNKTHT